MGLKRMLGRLGSGATKTGAATVAGVGAIAIANRAVLAFSGTMPMLAKWWASPVALLIIGHLLAKKYPALGHGVCGAAGAYGYMSYMNAAATPGAKGVLLPNDVRGIGDAGALVAGPGDAGFAYNETPALGMGAGEVVGDATEAYTLHGG